MDMKNSGNILALDCATTTGWCVGTVGKPIAQWGEIKLKNGESDLWDFLNETAGQYNVTRILAEDIFFNKNVQTFERLANYHGVINLFCLLRGIELVRKGLSPTQWKRALVGDAYASKDKVRGYVSKYVNAPIKSDNVSDAIGIFIAWRWLWRLRGVR